MKKVGIRQARQELPVLIDRAAVGEEIIITRQGRPVARLVAAARDREPLPSLVNFRGRLGCAGSPAARLVREERDAE